MKFNDYKYKRPDLDRFKLQFNELLEQFKNSSKAEEQIDAVRKLNSLRNEFETMNSIASIKYTLNTTDEVFDVEHSFFDESKPIVESMVFEYYKLLLDSKFRDALEKQFGSQLFNIASSTVKTNNKEIVDEMKAANKLTSKYTKLMASAKINFRGEALNISGLSPFVTSPDRQTRKEASEAKWGFFAKNTEEFDKIYDELVQVRNRAAKKAGHKNFIRLAYMNLKRTDYDENNVAQFRSYVLKHLVPFATELKERQMKRLGLDDHKYYDYDLLFKSGNARPKGDPEWIVSKAKEMYSELSGETDEFMTTMINGELMDLYNKSGKAPGGYCTFIPQHRSPYIFANMNGTSDDIRVLTHEAGHAFQAYSSRNYEVPEYVFPTLESAEIHSMSMEFITWPWMKLFFNGETEKFKFSHLERSVQFIPYGVTVDEFQHRVYENPVMTPGERKQVWRETEKKYLPWKKYEGNDFLENGGYWQSQTHIFKMPFYYIDYCLAMICALQFWLKMNNDRNRAWQEYLNLCKAGGSRSFAELLKVGNLESPFEESTIKNVIGDIKVWLDNIDDTKF